ncbi:MAG TPA: glycosyltransferase [Dongiaceae bacterium]|nr:glycosyltransferase [Dongiaceae bacterium]
MRLLIISGMPHHVRDGQVVGWGPTANEIDHLATLFASVRHVAPLHPGPGPKIALPYTASNIKFVPVPAAGGPRLRDKLRILAAYPTYLFRMLKELPHADVVHVRCPDNISLLAILLLARVIRPTTRWIKYAGNWQAYAGEPLSYRLQRRWLGRNLARAQVTVNGRWPGQPAHVHSFLNPCLTAEELQEGATTGAQKRLQPPVQLLFVGRLEAAKGAGIAVEIVTQLQAAGIEASLDLIGEGSPADRQQFEQQARDLGVTGRVRFHGGLPRPALREFFRRAHFLVLPTNCSEGWPKVLSEAMAYGAVPLTTAISSIPQLLEEFGTGRALTERSAAAFAAVIQEYLRNPAEWEQQSRRALVAAERFSYDNYLLAVRDLLKLPAEKELNHA